MYKHPHDGAGPIYPNVPVEVLERPHPFLKEDQVDDKQEGPSESA